jgi:hypothetical protein
MKVLKGIVGEVGTLMGPTNMGEWLIIRGQEEDGVRVGYAYPQEIQDVTLGLIEGERASVSR